MSDLFRKYKSLYSSTCNTFSTGESVTITPASVTGLPTDTEITLTFDRVDSSGTKTPDKMERIRGTVTGSNFVVSASGRAVEGTEQVHTSPVVEMVWNADDLNDIVDGVLVEHGQDGKHTSALVTTLKATGAVVNTGTSDVTIVTPKALADSDYAKTSDIAKATGAEIDTGTEDAKFATPKAIADSNISFPTKTETLTNKTLTSPKINENVALTATATELNKLDGTPTHVLGDLAAANEFIQRGSATFTCTSGASYITASITFPTAFTTLRSFSLIAGPSDNFSVPEMPVIFYTSTISASKLDFLIRTADGGNWAANRTCIVYYIAVGV